MKKTFTLFYLLAILAVSACSTFTPAPATALPTVELPTAQTPTHKTYSNSEYGLGFQFPASWFGPEEYVSDPILRVEIGSDKVYPYGTGLDERIYELKNSYSVVIQYSKNDQNPYWKDTYQSLLTLQDGASISDSRSLTIRVQQLNLGRFTGIEFISTLSETAQTEPVYTRQVILFDDQSNLLTIMGSPNNVEVNNGFNWHDTYRMIDETNVDIFHAIVMSITTE